MVNYLSFIFTVSSYNIYNSFEIRNIIKKEVNNNFKKISYVKAKSILHEELSFIDIYGDKKEKMNVEHVFPQYLFKNDTNYNVMKSDLHNLYLTNSKLNSHRNNYKFEDPYNFIDNDLVFLNKKGEKIETPDNYYLKSAFYMSKNNKKNIFYPLDYSRGKISRSLAYFAIKYDYLQELEKVIDINTLLKWNFDDPVSNEEYLKNILCSRYHGVYNPFILNNDLVYHCFSDYDDINHDLFNNKRIKSHDPLYSIEYLLEIINKIENKK